MVLSALAFLAGLAVVRLIAGCFQPRWPFDWAPGTVDSDSVAGALMEGVDVDDARRRLLRWINADPGAKVIDGTRVRRVTAAMIPTGAVETAVAQVLASDLTLQRYASVYGAAKAVGILDADRGFPTSSSRFFEVRDRAR
ncbi:hypothetical protein [Gordonia hirsuta]|uniref:hypothetical protein n=1 Tax=Gordonia hirsuta TaxID=53427 RepID=UPI0012DF4CC7|nr:hypothetical protein [Gordonia hirsuta]